MIKWIAKMALRRYLASPIDLAMLANRREDIQRLLSDVTQALNDDQLSSSELQTIAERLVDVFIV